MQLKTNIRHIFIIVLCFLFLGVFYNCSSGSDPASSTDTGTIDDSQSSIIGSWFCCPDALADSGVLTFIDATNYMFAVDGDPDDGGGRGMERGTYTWDSTSGAFTATSISASATLGDWGISDLNTMTVSIVGDTLDLNDSVEGLISFTKVQ